MRKHKAETYEQATAAYTKLTGNVPTFDQMCDMYHKYRNTLFAYKWESFAEFMEWYGYGKENNGLR